MPLPLLEDVCYNVRCTITGYIILQYCIKIAEKSIKLFRALTNFPVGIRKVKPVLRSVSALLANI